jgi:hypothetical protein
MAIVVIVIWHFFLFLSTTFCTLHFEINYYSRNNLTGLWTSKMIKINFFCVLCIFSSFSFSHSASVLEAKHFVGTKTSHLNIMIFLFSFFFFLLAAISIIFYRCIRAIYLWKFELILGFFFVIEFCGFFLPFF